MAPPEVQLLWGVAGMQCLSEVIHVGVVKIVACGHRLSEESKTSGCTMGRRQGRDGVMP